MFNGYFRAENKVVWFFCIFISIMSHGVLDAITSGGRPIGFFIPFQNRRFFFPFHDIRVSPIGIYSFLSNRGIQVNFGEFKYIFLS
jgi:inner membrane protein